MVHYKVNRFWIYRKDIKEVLCGFRLLEGPKVQFLLDIMQKRIRKNYKLRTVHGTYVITEQENWDQIYTLNPFVEFQLHKYILNKKADVFIDVGAFMGVHAISWAIKNPNARVFAVEAAPRNYEKLKENITENKLSNVESLNFAAGSTFGNLYFPNLVSSKFTGSEKEESHTTRVKVFRIDEILDLGSIRSGKILIKIDVEENEKEVLSGITNILKSSRSVSLVIEIWKQSEVRAITNFLADFGVEKVGNLSGSNYVFEREFSFQGSDINHY